MRTITTALLLGAAALVAYPAFAADADTHTVHSKQMKSAGVKDGEPMSNAPAASAPAGDDAASKPGPGKHCMHDKKMRNDNGVKEGDCMTNARPSATEAPAADAGSDTHTVHSKAMKNDAGVKDGDKMANPH